MGWYLRKAFSFGPLRLNLSKSGLGYSFGVRGARIGVGPRGTYVHMGRGGVYYRQYLSSPSGENNLSPAAVPPALPSVLTQELPPIETADASALRDSTAAELMSELQEKNAKARYAVVVIVASVVALVAMLAAGGPLLVCGAFVIVCAVLHYEAQMLDIERKRVSLRYELDKDAAGDYASLLGAVATLSRSAARWRLTAEDLCRDPKYHAGASKTVDRKGASLAVSAPSGVETNLAIWRLDVGEQVVYFLPDRLLVTQGGSFGGVEYRDLTVQDSSIRFIEGGGVPSDSQVVDWTWQFTNKGGGPDRRFANNRQIPVVNYGELHLRSASGMHIVLHVSDPSKLQQFASGVRDYARHHDASAASEGRK